MRTTIVLDEDVRAAIEKERTTAHLGISEAVNQLIRRGLASSKKPARFVQRAAPLGLRIDVRNIGEALEVLEGPTER
jgi:hypothetical protein